MPPRPAKKGSGGSTGARKTAARTAKGTPKAKNQAEVSEDPPKAEETRAPVEEVKEESKVEEVVVEKTVQEKPVVLDSSQNDPESVDVECMVFRPFSYLVFFYLLLILYANLKKVVLRLF